MITVYTVSYNEEAFIQFMIDHYRSRFLGCEIVVYDNESTDSTVKIAKDNGCQVISYSTNNKISDSKYLEIKNNCWKSAKTDWVLVCDTDELLDVNEDCLSFEHNNQTSIIRSEAFDMVNMECDFDLKSICYGARAPNHDKSYLFNKALISEINYEPGCHKSNPSGLIKYSSSSYRLYHYNFINEDLTMAKYKTYASRLSDENIKNGWGSHYLLSEEQIKDFYKKTRQNAVRLF
jgi:glycosyltransferase involved in cell wall biosynthesis